MRRLTSLFTAAAIAVLQGACSDAGTVLPPAPTAPTASRAGAALAEDGVRRVEMLDACDPASFDAVLGAGACTRSGGLNFSDFIAQVTAKGEADAWRFVPGNNLEARVGETLLAINRGGEVHTFTEVARFGGGIIPLLNQLSHNPDVAPECQTLQPSDFIAAGGTTTDEVEGDELYQCCIHPWMRTTVHARGS